jgi:hypothetical protein
MELASALRAQLVPVPRVLHIPATVIAPATAHTGTPAFRWTGTFEGVMMSYKDPEQVHEAGNDTTGWFAKVMQCQNGFEVLVYDEDGDRRAINELTLPIQADAMAWADKVVLPVDTRSDPPFSSQPHFIEGMRYPLSIAAQKVPPIPCAFKVGDSVTFTNDYGVAFHNKIVTGFAPIVEYGRFVFLDMDAWWFPSKPASLTHTSTESLPG